MEIRYNQISACNIRSCIFRLLSPRGSNWGMQFAIFAKIPRWWEECDADDGRIGWIYYEGSRVHGSRETKWNYRCDCYWSISVRRGHRQRSINDSLSSLSTSSLRLLPSFFPKDNPRWSPFCLLSEIACSEIDRRLRPTDVCSAATALTLRHRKNIIGFSFLIFFLVFFLTHCLLLFGFFSGLGTSPREERRPLSTVGSWERARKYFFTYHHVRCSLQYCVTYVEKNLSRKKARTFYLSRLFFHSLTWRERTLGQFDTLWFDIFCCIQQA